MHISVGTGCFAWAILSLAALPAVAAPPSAVPPAAPQTASGGGPAALPGGDFGSFTVAENGHAVGTASFQFTASGQGFDSTSLVKVSMQGLDYELSKTEQLSAALQLRQVQVSAVVNGEAVTVAATPDAAQFVLHIAASGKSTTTRLTGHQDAAFIADFDPGALETLLQLAAAHNNRDLWAILPMNTGSIEPVQLATYADQQGTLDGRPIVAHHLVATIAGAHTDLFAGPENQLLQAELPQSGFVLLRKNFVLTPPARPVEPAAGLAAPPGQGAPADSSAGKP